MRYMEPTNIAESSNPLPYLELEDKLAELERNLNATKSEAVEATEIERIGAKHPTALRSIEEKTEGLSGIIGRVRYFLRTASFSPVTIFNLIVLPVTGLILILPFLVLSGAVANGAEPAVEKVADTLNRSAQGLPGDTELFGSFQGSGTVSFTDPESKQLQRSELIESQGSYYSYEISGTVDDYSIELNFEKGSKEHQLTYDSTTNRTTEKELN